MPNLMGLKWAPTGPHAVKGQMTKQLPRRQCSPVLFESFYVPLPQGCYRTLCGVVCGTKIDIFIIINIRYNRGLDWHFIINVETPLSAFDRQLESEEHVSTTESAENLEL